MTIVTTVTARTILATAAVALSVLTGCTQYDDFGEASLEIEQPASHAEVAPSFDVRFDTSVELGQAGDTPFVRVFVDGVHRGDTRDPTFTIHDARPGAHRIHASVLDSGDDPIGAEDEVTVTVEDDSA